MDAKVFFVGKYKVDDVENYATLEECVNYVKTLKIVGIDIETTRKFKRGTYDESVYRGGLDPYLSNIVMLQIGSLDRVYVIDVRDFENSEIQPIIDYLHYNNDIIIVGQNLKFEGKHLKHRYGLRMKNVWDTMIAEINLTNGLPFRYGLANLAERYLKVKKSEDLSLFGSLYENKTVTLNDYYIEQNSNILTPFEIEESFYIDKSTRLQFVTIGKKQFNAKQILYGADDIVFPLLIRERQLLGRALSSGEVYNPRICHKVENTFTQVLADIELEGLGFDKQKWVELANKNKATYDDRKEKLEDYVKQVYPQFTVLYDLFNPEHSCRVEWSSPKQVIELFRNLKICPKEMSKQTRQLEWTVGAVSLLKTVPNNIKDNYFKNRWVDFEKDENGKYVEDKKLFTLAYLLLKKSEQQITTFGMDWLKYIHPITGRVHSNYRQILNTSRMSSNNPNLQNLPGGDFRKCFIAKEGNKILNADYSTQEIRIVADVTQDRAFVDFFIKGDETFGSDFHSYTATKMYRLMEDNPDLLIPPKDLPNGDKNPAFLSEHGKKRNNAKAINFKINYGGSAYTLKDDFGVEEEVAQQFIDTYLNAFPSLREDFKRAKREAVEHGFVMIDDFTDRRWFCPFYQEMVEVGEKVREYYPEEYFGRGMKKEDKAKVKAEITANHPEVSDMWRLFFRLKGKLERNGLNYRIQGKAAMMMKASMNILRHKLILADITDFLLTNLVHDEAVAESPITKTKEYGDLLSECMVEGTTYFCKTVPQAADTVVADYWTH